MEQATRRGIGDNAEAGRQAGTRKEGVKGTNKMKLRKGWVAVMVVKEEEEEEEEEEKEGGHGGGGVKKEEKEERLASLSVRGDFRYSPRLSPLSKRQHGNT